MKNILTQVFVTLGVIFLIVIVIGTYFFVTDPFNLKPLILGSGSGIVQPNSPNATSVENGSNGSETATQPGGFQLSDAQKQALVSLGVDPSTIPSTVSAEKESCFVSVLGEARVEEIKAGAIPSAYEFFKAKACV